MASVDEILAPVIEAFREAVKQLVDAAQKLRKRDEELARRLREYARIEDLAKTVEDKED